MKLLLLLSAAAAWAAGPTVTHSHRLAGTQKKLESPLAFRAAVVAWDTRAATRSIALRASLDGSAWTPWFDVETEAASPEEGTAGPVRTSGLVFLGEPYRFVELRGDTDGVDVILVDPGQTAAPAVAKRPSSRAAVDAPAIVSRAGWGCTEAACPRASAPSYTTVTHLIVHHTAGANSATDWAAIVRSIWVLHVQGNGWNDIGYNYLIDPTGAVYEGRGDGVLGAHFSGVNTGTMGVSLMGTYSTIPPTDAAVASLDALLAWQASKWSIEPSGQSLHSTSGLVLNHISGHRDAGLSSRATSTTECPGNGVYAQLPDVRQTVRAAVRGACPQALSVASRCVGADAGTLDVTVEAAAGCAVALASGAEWITASATATGVRLAYSANSGARRTGAVAIGGDAFSLTQAAAGEWPLACIARNGVLTAGAVDARPVVAGSLVSVYGTGLASGEAAATAYPLPVELAGTSLLVNGTAVPLVYAGAGQINAQLPTGLATGSARAAVRANGVTGPETMFWVSEAVPSIFTESGRAIATNYTDGSRNSASAPVAPGGILTVWLEGAGGVKPALPTAGTAATEALPAKLSWSATIDGRAAGLLYLGVAPGLAGVYQANVVVPDGTAAGDRALTVTVGGAASRPATVAVGGK